MTRYNFIVTKEEENNMVVGYFVEAATGEKIAVNGVIEQHANRGVLQNGGVTVEEMKPSPLVEKWWNGLSEKLRWNVIALLDEKGNLGLKEIMTSRTNYFKERFNQLPDIVKQKLIRHHDELKIKAFQQKPIPKIKPAPSKQKRGITSYMAEVNKQIVNALSMLKTVNKIVELKVEIISSDVGRICIAALDEGARSIAMLSIGSCGSQPKSFVAMVKLADMIKVAKNPSGPLCEYESWKAIPVIQEMPKKSVYTTIVN